MEVEIQDEGRDGGIKFNGGRDEGAVGGKRDRRKDGEMNGWRRRRDGGGGAMTGRSCVAGRGVERVEGLSLIHI